MVFSALYAGIITEISTVTINLSSDVLLKCLC